MSNRLPSADDLRKRPDTPPRKKASGSVHSNLPLDPNTQGAENIKKALAMETRTEFVTVNVDTFMHASFPDYRGIPSEKLQPQHLLAFDKIPSTAKEAVIQEWLDRRSGISKKETGKKKSDKTKSDKKNAEKLELVPKTKLTISHCEKEENMYIPMAEIFQSFLGDSFRVIVTGGHHDPSAPESQKWRPDLSVYEIKEDILTIEDLENHRTQFAHIELPIEVKPTSGPSIFNDGRNGDECLSEDGSTPEIVRGQLATVLAAIQARQFRTAVFMIYLRDPDVRLIRADRAGVLVTEAIDFRQNPTPLATFLHAFGSATREQRGYDGSAAIVPHGKEKNTSHDGYPSDWAPTQWNPLWEVTVPSAIPQPEDIKHLSYRTVYVWKARGPAKSLTGRGTLCYEAFDLESKKRCFLKNYWRPDVESIPSESAILTVLRDKQVPRIPNVTAGGDVSVLVPLMKEMPMEGSGMVSSEAGGTSKSTELFDGSDIRILNRTITQKYFPNNKTRPDGRVNHRLLMDIIPRFLVHCTDSKQPFQAIYDAFQAHKRAYEVGFIHRDISSGNVLLDASNRGVLSDWDLAAPVDPKEKEYAKDGASHLARQVYRTGTWSFMSINLLQRLTGSHTLSDDLQSFLWLTTHVGAEVLPLKPRSEFLDEDENGGLMIQRRRTFVKTVFESFDILEDTRRQRGGANKKEFIADPDTGDFELNFSGNQAINNWVRALLDKWRPTLWTKGATPKEFTNHAYMERLFREALNAPASEWSTEKLPGKSLVWPDGYDALIPTKVVKKSEPGASVAPIRTSQRTKPSAKSSHGG